MKTVAAFVVLVFLSAVSTVASVPDSACPMFANNSVLPITWRAAWDRLWTINPSIRNGK